MGEGIMVNKRIPRHIGIIPDGNRRWALAKGFPKEMGYEGGIEPAKRIFDEVWDLGIEEVSVYIFTKENAKRPARQVNAFKEAFFEYLTWVREKDISILVVGDKDSPVFPKELHPLTIPDGDRDNKRKLNFLVNYNWKWDLSMAMKGNGGPNPKGRELMDSIGSRHVSRIDLVIRWGDRTRLSGFLPVQSAYADLYVVPSLWPDFEIEQLHEALRWYSKQDITLGG
jgi:undecaprenyl diphosphate synthase